METKKWYQSRTIWLAMLQIMTATVAILVSHNILIGGTAGLAIVKAILDIGMRTVTSKEIEL